MENQETGFEQNTCRDRLNNQQHDRADAQEDGIGSKKHEVREVTVLNNKPSPSK